MKNERMIAQPVFDENRMYLRTYDSLLCIGRKGEEGETFEKQARIGALLDRFPFRPQRPAVAQVVTRLNWPRPRAGATLPT